MSTFPSNTVADGVWSLKQQRRAILGNDWPALAPPDPNFNLVSLLLNTDGVDGGQNNTFTDSSSSSHTITRVGNTTQGSVNPFGDYWSNYFAGGVGGDNLVVANTGTTIGTDDFTIEGWFYFDGIGAGTVYTLLDGRTGGDTSNLMWAQESSGAWTIFNGAGGTISSGWTGSTFTEGQWYHIAQTRTGGTSRFFVNGTLTGSPSDSSNYDSQQYTVGGRYAPNGSNLTGYLSNFRIVKGTALYTASFTPPTAPLTAITGTLVLTCQSNSFKDASTNDFAITVAGTPKVTSFAPFADTDAYDPSAVGGSGYFDGLTNYLSVPYDTSLQLPADFTIECWVYVISKINSFPTVFNNYNVYGTNGGIGLFASHNSGAAGKYNIAFNGSFPVINSTDNIAYGSWQHLAIVRSGSTITLYVDGVANGTTTSSATVQGTANNWWIGVEGNSIGSAEINAYMSDFRVVKGTAVYTSAFTPPTEPLTAIAGTSLLLNFEDAAIYDAAQSNNLLTVADAQVDTAVTKFGTGSIKFDGTGDYLEIPNKPELILAGGPWTVECWVRPDGNYSDYNVIFTKRIISSTSTSYSGYLNTSTGYIGFYNGTIYLSSTALTSNVWSHCAWVYDGTNINIYVNGVSVLSTAVTITEVDTELVIGDARGWTEFFFGYIEDLRITKGLARYTTTFTPPTAAFPTTGE